jgi:hypothetical protein
LKTIKSKERETKIKHNRTTSVLQDCGFSAFLETFVLNQSSGIFRNFSAKRPQPRKAL